MSEGYSNTVTCPCKCEAGGAALHPRLAAMTSLHTVTCEFYSVLLLPQLAAQIRILLTLFIGRPLSLTLQIPYMCHHLSGETQHLLDLTC
eukprot:3226789-Amphidinium_carterae.1